MTHLTALLDVAALIKSFGLLGIFAIVFAESGLFFGFFFPGDSLLFTAGLLSSEHYLHFWPLLLGSIIAAILGDSVGYSFGRRMGKRLFHKAESLFFKKEYADKAERFFETHGRKSIILARFVPVIRTFVPIVAGVGKMEYRRFISYNVIGGALWAGGLVFMGFFLGKIIPNVDHYLLPIIGVIIIISIVPAAIELYKNKEKV